MNYLVSFLLSRSMELKGGIDYSSGDSSDNVPLIKMVDKLKTQTRTKTLPTTARETPSKVLKNHNRRIVENTQHLLSLYFHYGIICLTVVSLILIQ